MHNAEFKRCLEELDVEGVRRLWAHTAPHLKQPENDIEVLFSLHHARTQSETMELRRRAYSHRWLIDNGYPSGLPDNLKPRAERLYPKVVEGVGISVNANAEWLKPVTKLVREAMSDAVNDAYAEGNTEPAFVKKRMSEAAKAARKKLLGF